MGLRSKNEKYNYRENQLSSIQKDSDYDSINQPYLILKLLFSRPKKETDKFYFKIKTPSDLRI